MGVFSSAKIAGAFAPPLDKFNELRLEAVPDAGPSDSSSSSSSEPPRFKPSPWSLDMRAALTACCAALLLDLRM